MAALLRAKDDMLAKCNEHAAELARLTRERTTQQEPSYIGRPANIETAVPSYTESSAVVRHAAARAEQAPSGDLPREATSWPVCSSFPASWIRLTTSRRKSLRYISVVPRQCAAVIWLVGTPTVLIIPGYNGSISKCSSSRRSGRY